MNGGHGYGNDALYLNNHTAVAGTLHFQENTLLSRKVTADDTDFHALGQIQFIGLEIQEMVVIGTRYGDETLHLTVGDDYLPSAAGIGDVLQVTDLGLHTLHIRRTGMNKKQIVNNRNQNSNFSTFPYAYLVLHGDETAQFFFFKKMHSIRLSTISGTHSIPYFALFIHFHFRDYFRKGCSLGALRPLHTLEFQSLANALCKIGQALRSSCQLIFYCSSLP